VNATPERARADLPADAESGTEAERVLAFCKSRWENAGLGSADVADMLDELRTHLADAAARGRTPADVLGPDMEEFARSWASARVSRGERWLRLAMYSIGMSLALLLLAHLLRTTMAVPVTPGFLVFLVGLPAINLVWRPKGGALTFGRVFVASLFLLIPTAVLDGWLLRDTVLFRVPLWITIAAAVIVGLLTWLFERRSAGAGDKRDDR
jgi:hypothetical protein